VTDLIVRVQDVFGEPLKDRMDIEVAQVRDGSRVARKDDLASTRAVRFTQLKVGALYLARAFPFRHRAAKSPVILLPHSGEANVDIVCPVHPDRVNRVTFPAFANLAADLRRILEATRGAEGFETISGESLYMSLPDISKAGLLNLFAKMDRTRFPDGTSVAEHVIDLYRLRGDRVFANVDVRLRDLVKESITRGDLEEVRDALHTPPPGFHSADSFKTRDGYGNLQITFFASDDAPLRFKADIDIDDANGIAHGFQVLRNGLCDRTTHPFDIHQILVFHQQLYPGYQLAAI
jgi:hypothetical protein